MSPEVFVEILREAMFMVIVLVSAVMLVTLLALSWGGNWLVQKLMDFTFHMVEMIPQVVG